MKRGLFKLPEKKQKQLQKEWVKKHDGSSTVIDTTDAKPPQQAKHFPVDFYAPDIKPPQQAKHSPVDFYAPDAKPPQQAKHSPVDLYATDALISNKKKPRKRKSSSLLRRLKFQKAMDILSIFRDKAPPGFDNTIDILIGHCHGKNKSLLLMIYTSSQDVMSKIDSPLFIFDKSLQDWQACDDAFVEEESIDFYKISPDSKKLIKNEWKLLLEKKIILEIAPC